MTRDQFIDELFGLGWTDSQLPVFLEMLRKMQEDAKRYHELRESIARGSYWIADRASLNRVDDEVDAARQSGLL
jgi:hypothetical protein